MSKTGWLSLQPAGSPVAPFSVRSRRRLPQAPASLSQSTPWAALAGHLGLVFGLVFDIGPEGILLRVLHLNTVRSRLAALRESLARQHSQILADTAVRLPPSPPLSLTHPLTPPPPHPLSPIPIPLIPSSPHPRIPASPPAPRAHRGGRRRVGREEKRLRPLL